jgi:hypothetical protein
MPFHGVRRTVAEKNNQGRTARDGRAGTVNILPKIGCRDNPRHVALSGVPSRMDLLGKWSVFCRNYFLHCWIRGVCRSRGDSSTSRVDRLRPEAPRLRPIFCRSCSKRSDCCPGLSASFCRLGISDRLFQIRGPPESFNFRDAIPAKNSIKRTAKPYPVLHLFRDRAPSQHSCGASLASQNPGLYGAACVV